jgi:hypothetical protein
MSRADKYLICGVLFVVMLSAPLLYFQGLAQRTGTDPCRAVIMVQGRSAETIELADNGTRKKYVFHGRKGPAMVEVDGRRIRMVDAPCPDRICVRRGWIETVGESIVCIPNEIYISIKANGVAPVDAVTR